MLVPKLRFKNFNDEWKIFKIQDTFDNISIKNCPNMTILTIIQGHGTIPRNQSNRNIIFDEEKSRTYKMVNKKDFIIHLRSFEGGLEMSNHNGIVSPAYTIIRGKDIVIPLFFKYYFRTNKFINSILSKSVEGIRDGKQISYNQLKDFYIPIPSIEEQTKIANFLSLIDRKIELQEKLVENLKLYKKGLLKKVFSNNQGWKSAKLGDLGKFYRGHSYKSIDVSQNSNDLLVLRSNNIQSNRIIFNDLQFCKKKCHSDILLQNNDIIVCMANGSKKLVGKSAIYQNKLNKDNVTVGAFCSIFRSDLKIIPYLFQSKIYYNNLNLLLEGTNINNLKNADLANITFKIPSIEEQNRIANLFTSLDKKIELETKKLQDLKTYKKGLLQKMFI